jgi:hypothetical protein
MENSNDILEVRFSGNDINPSAVKPREIAELIIGFEKALLSDIKDRNPEIDTNELLFGFKAVEDKSVGIQFAPKLVRDIVVTSFTFISTSFETGDFSQLSNNTINELKTFTKFSKKYQCSGEFNLNGNTLSSFTPTTELKNNINPILEGEVKIFGKVVDSGGNNPNVHLKISDEKELIFPTTETLAKELAHRLYEKVSLVGIAKWDAITYEIKSFKIKEIVDFAPGKTLSALNELRNLTGGYWDKYNTNDEINNQLLRD